MKAHPQWTKAGLSPLTANGHLLLREAIAAGTSPLEAVTSIIELQGPGLEPRQNILHVVDIVGEACHKPGDLVLTDCP
jgi:hypothetical protein